MNALALREWEAAFETVPVRVGKGRRMKLAGILTAGDELEELPVLPAQRGSTSKNDRGSIRAFLVRGGALAGDGLQSGDHVLVEEAKEYPPDALLLVKMGGVYLLRQKPHLPAEPVVQTCVLGALIGIVRKRGFARTTPAQSPAPSPRLRRSAASLRILRGQLGMLESTCSNTRNPRLQKALRNEADRVRRQLQNGACSE